MSKVIRFTVFAKPQPAGSKRAFALRRGDGSLVTRPDGSPVINVIDDNAQSRQWKNLVVDAARQAYAGPPLIGPLAVLMRFFRARPAGHFGTGRNAYSLKASAPEFPGTKPDVLKLARGTEDALTSVIWRDDAQTVNLTLQKRWGTPERCEIEIVLLSEEPLF